jgi:hypothetical protein
VLTVDACTSMDPSSCGTDPSSHYEVVAGGPSIPVSMAQFPNPLGFYRFHVALENQDSTPAKDEKGKTYPAEEVIELTERCGEPPPPPKDSGTPHPDAGTDAQVVGPDTGPNEPRDSSAPDASAVPEAGPPPNDATAVPDAAPIRDARVPDATTPVDSGPSSVPSDAATGG